MNFDRNSNIYNQPTFDIYVNSLPKDIKENDLMQLFLKYGEIVGILCRHKTGEFGYAIVKFKHKYDAEKLLEERNTVSINGHYMEVKCAKRNINYEKDSKGNKNKPFVPKMNFTINEATKHHGNSSYLLKDSSFHHGSSYMEKQNVPYYPGMVEVLCTNVENAITFYGCPVFRSQELHNLSTQLNEICPNLPRLKKGPAMNKLYAALFLEDMSWYRCQVLHRCIPFKPGMCAVYYIDYGNQEDILLQNMVELPDAMRSIPPFSIKYVFSSLECNLQTKSQSEVTYLHHLVNHRMSLGAYPSGNQECQVLRCICNGIDVISEIVKKGFAAHKAQRSSHSSHSSLKCEKNKNKSHKKVSKTVDTADLCHSAQKLVLNKTTKNKSTTLNFENNSLQENDSLPKVNGCVSPGETDHKSVSNSLKKDTDFVPKKIIKRGCELDALDFIQRHDENAGKQCLVKVDTVLANLKLINNIRDLVSLSDDDDDIINDAVNIFFCEMNTSCMDSTDHVENAIKEYMDDLNIIKNCSDKSKLSQLKSKRDSAHGILVSRLKEYLDNFDLSLFERKNNIQKMIIDLESNSNAWMNIYLNNPPSAVEDLLTEYKKVKGEKKSYIHKARENTNEKHQVFLKFLSAFQKEFCLNLLEDGKETSNGVLDVCCKKVSWSVKFDDTLSDLGKALEEEIEACTLNRGSSSSSIVQCILEKLDIPKEKLDIVCGIYKKYSCLLEDLSNLPDFQSALLMLVTAEEKILNLDMQLFNYQGSSKLDVQDLLLQLHHILLEKDTLMETISKASELPFPEINIEYPELMLEEYCNSQYLLKHGWKSDYFPCYQKCERSEYSYVSKFLGESVAIKEYSMKNDNDKKYFLQKIITWKNVKSDFLVKVIAVFYKDENTLCILTNPAWNTVSEMPCAPFPAESKTTVQMLQKVLLSLKDIHSRQVAHGSIHPLTVLYEEGKILLDLCFRPTDVLLKTVKGINFQPPNNTQICESADMYSFGCLVLWALFPNLSFVTTAQGVPNLTAFKSIVEQLLSSKDYALLSALLDANAEVRPSSCVLLSNGFLKEYASHHQFCN